MFQDGKLCKHRAFVDVCFRILISYGMSDDESQENVLIMWFRQKGLTPMGFTETLGIKSEQFKNYSEVRE